MLMPNGSLNTQRSTLNFNGAIAQLVEQRTENPCVPGSIPGGTTKKTQSDRGCVFFLFKSYPYIPYSLYYFYSFYIVGTQHAVSSVEQFLRSKRANFVVSESRSKVYFDYAECEQNLDKNRYIRMAKI